MNSPTQRRSPRFHATIAGRRFRLDRQRIERALVGVPPEPIRDHYVIVAGRRYPPKQVISVVTRLDRADFTTHQARRVLLRAGLSAARRSQRSPDGVEAAYAESSPYAEALRPYIGQWVATERDEVLIGADTVAEVVSWLSQHNRRADSLFRVPETVAAASGVAPG